MKRIFILIMVCAAAITAVTLITACDHQGTLNSLIGELKNSIQVNNQAAGSRTIAAGDTVELYIHTFEYLEDANNRALILIADGDRDQGSKGGILTNAGWYSADEDLSVHNDSHFGSYSSFQVRISKLRINGTEYPFPDEGKGSRRTTMIFGHPSGSWGGVADYPDNFPGINITVSDSSLKTILTVEPGILDSTGNLVPDPYTYIKVEGKVSE